VLLVAKLQHGWRLLVLDGADGGDGETGESQDLGGSGADGSVEGDTLGAVLARGYNGY
jgi:hypothetical protein